MNMGNMQGMMKQVQKMQQDMMKEQENLQQKTFTKTSAGDLVTITALGNKQVQNIDIKQEVLDPDDPDMLQDLLVTTFNDLMTEIDRETERVMSRFTRGMNLPF